MYSIDIGNTPVWSLLPDSEIICYTNKTISRLAYYSQSLRTGWPVDLERDILLEDTGSMLPVFLPKHPLGMAMALVPQAQKPAYDQRTPSALIAYKFWPSAEDRITAQTIREINQISTGHDRYRDKSSAVRSRADMPALVYCSPDAIAGRIDILLNIMNTNPQDLDPLALAIGVLQDCLLIHPFADGNGRLARLLFQMTLAMHLNLKAPIVPLLPAMASNRTAFRAAYLCWYFDLDPRPLVRIVCQWINWLLDTYEFAE